MRCDECGYDYNEVARDEVAPRIRAFGDRYRRLLGGRDDEALRLRPSPEVWSPLEYTCHLRDVFRTQTDRIRLALEQDTPRFASMRREERVAEERYNEQDVETVLGELAAAADELARCFESLDDAAWLRKGIYSYPTEAVRTVEWIGVHTIHEGEHHLMDVGRQLR
jgi:S-DNA-T family DNA segregation ATPase FtsK/SpoIIIE